MKNLLRRLFSPILNLFESGSAPYAYKASHRTILLIMGGLFCGLAALVLYFARGADLGYFLPVVIFGGVGLLSLLIGFLGSDRAVAKVWGSR